MEESSSGGSPSVGTRQCLGSSGAAKKKHLFSGESVRVFLPGEQAGLVQLAIQTQCAGEWGVLYPKTGKRTTAPYKKRGSGCSRLSDSVKVTGEEGKEGLLSSLRGMWQATEPIPSLSTYKNLIKVYIIWKGGVVWGSQGPQSRPIPAKWGQ